MYCFDLSIDFIGRAVLIDYIGSFSLTLLASARNG